MSTGIKAAIVEMVVMWALGIGVLALIILILVGRYNLHMPALFFASLFFGLFSLRNCLPGTPYRHIKQFLALLWVQGVVALGLIISIVATLKRRPN